MISTDGHHHHHNSCQQLQPISVPKSPQNVVTDLISSNFSSRLIPKIGSIVKRFSLNYSGEGLVTGGPQRARTVRVGIRFQVQVDSFLNNNQQQQQQLHPGNQRPRALNRAQSVPIESIDFPNNLNSSSCEQNNRGFCDSNNLDSSSINNRQLALEYSPPRKSPTLQRSYNSSTSLKDQSDLDFDSSSGVSSLAGSNPTSPVIDRRHSSSLAFHNRINQALSLCRNQLAAVAASRERDYSTRRASVQVLRRGSVTPERSPNSTVSNTPQRGSIMEDSSSYQVLRYFPGSNINSAREFSWETAAFEKDVRDRVQWLGDTFSSMRIPPFVSRLFTAAKTYAFENPITAVLIVTLAIACSLPITIFLGFAVATILFTFLGFLFVEGTLLTVATLTFGGVVLIVGLVTLAITLLGFLGYFTSSQIYSFATGKAFDLRSDVLRKLPFIGHFFEESSSLHQELSTSKPTSNGSVHKMTNGHVVNKIDDDDDDEEDEDDEEGFDEHIEDESTIEEEDDEEEEIETGSTDNVEFFSTNGDEGVEVETESSDRNLLQDGNRQDPLEENDIQVQKDNLETQKTVAQTE